MSDLRTEIVTKVLPKMQSLTNLTFDDDPNATVQVADVPLATNMTDQIWRFVKANPSSTVKDISNHIGDDKGVSTRINQLRNRGYIKTDFSTFPHRHSVDKEYTGVNKEERTARMLAARAVWAKNLQGKLPKNKPKKPMGRPPHAKPAAPAVKPSRVVDLNNLSIIEARKLYDELKHIFGG